MVFLECLAVAFGVLSIKRGVRKVQEAAQAERSKHGRDDKD